MGDILANDIKLSNNSEYKCELYFSLLSTYLVMNTNKILGNNYQIYEK